MVKLMALPCRWTGDAGVLGWFRNVVVLYCVVVVVDGH